MTRILVDANVLYARTLRDWLLQLQDVSAGAMFTTCYTEDIRAEVLSKLRKNNPDMDGKALTVLSDRIAAAMWERIDDYPALPDAPVSDALDRHVHAAAVAGAVDILLTQDRDFLDLTENVRDRLTYEICAPDHFFTLIDDGHPGYVRQVTKRTWEYWRQREPGSDISVALEAAGCPNFAERVRRHIHKMR